MSSQHIEGEAEALQTDIQRFIAILGFCLMAVFALVQAIPVTGQEEKAIIEELKHMVQTQNQELISLKAENSKLIKETILLKANKQVVASLSRSISETKNKLDQHENKIDRLLKEKIEQVKDIAMLKKIVAQRDVELEQLKNEKMQMERILEKTRETVENSKAEKDKVKEPPVEKIQEEGLYVAFESDRIFMDLLRSERISLFIRIKDSGQGFRVFMRNGEIRFRSKLPGQGFDLWQVREDAIPARVLEAFRSWTALASRGKMLIVGLKPDISHQIQRRNVTSGRFIIREGGMVTYSPFGE